jgi:pyridoxine kinase
MKMNNKNLKIAAIHDLSGYGRASLTVVIPILSSMGIQVCPLPTAVLSSHSEYKNYHCIDLTSHMQAIIDHWKELHIEFDAIYSGYLASSEQVSIVKRFIKDFKKENQFVIIDPVMGDNGSLYPGINNNLVEEMKSLIKDADIITPNLTEAAYLSGMDINENSNIEEIKECALKLAQEGPDYIIISSVPSIKENEIAVLCYDKKNDIFNIITNEYIKASYPGTGDAFTSVITGSLLNGDNIETAITNASNFIVEGIKATMKRKHDPLNGINQEEVLHTLTTSFSNN